MASVLVASIYKNNKFYHLIFCKLNDRTCSVSCFLTSDYFFFLITITAIAPAIIITATTEIMIIVLLSVFFSFVF